MTSCVVLGMDFLPRMILVNILMCKVASFFFVFLWWWYKLSGKVRFCISMYELCTKTHFCVSENKSKSSFACYTYAACENMVQIWNLLALLIRCHDYRYSVRAKRVFAELHERPFIVELDQRGNLLLIFKLWLWWDWESASITLMHLLPMSGF